MSRAAPTQPGHETDAFVRVAHALHEELATHPPRRSATGPAFDAPARNRMLDTCGSDHRPLVDLLLGVGVLLHDRLIEGAPDSRASWDVRRAPLVHAVVSTRYLQPDVARWAVDAWAVALAVAPPSILVAPELASVSPRATVAPIGPTTSSPRTTPAARPHRGAPAGMAPLPSTAAQHGAMPRYRIGSKTAPLPRPTVPLNPRFVARMQQVERAATISFIALAITVVILLWSAIANVRAGRLRLALRSGRTPDGTVYITAPAPVAATVGAPAAPDAVPTVTGQDSPYPRAPERQVSDARDSALVIQSRLSHEWLRAALAAGVGGAYTVEQQVRRVDGSESCTQVADALRARRTSVEQIMHVPGSSVLVLASRGASGHVYDDGHFELGPHSGTTNGVRWTFRMQGRFTPAGFAAQSETQTFAVIRWGRTQSCIAIADVVGRKADS